MLINNPREKHFYTLYNSVSDDSKRAITNVSCGLSSPVVSYCPFHLWVLLLSSSQRLFLSYHQLFSSFLPSSDFSFPQLACTENIIISFHNNIKPSHLLDQGSLLSLNAPHRKPVNYAAMCGQYML
jgi:hypothetical protein